jgi:predicted ATPase
MSASVATQNTEYRYRITSIKFNDGSSLKPGNLVVLVGPNNAGKSRSLRDILSICAPTQSISPRPLVVREVKWAAPASITELESREKVYIREEANGMRLLRSLDPSLNTERNHNVSAWTDQNLKAALISNEQLFAMMFGSQCIAHLGTHNRLQLVQQTRSPEFRKQASHLLHALYWKKSAVDQIRSVIKNQFDIDLALDFSTLAQIVLRVGKDLDQIPPDPRDALEILDKCERLDDQGDGLRSFTGILAALLCADRDVFLIDEPEAFLHPPQAFRIGELLAENASDDRQIFVATHSSDVLQGMLGKAPDATIVRLQRIGDNNQFRVLDRDDLRAITVDPLLQSARVLDGIFYPAAMVVEADADARFYQSASHKMAPKADIHTVNAQNKQTVARVASLYRKLGIPCAGIVDFDVLNDSNEFAAQLDALTMADAEKQGLFAIRQEIAEFVERLPALERADAAISELRELLSMVDLEMTESCRQQATCIERVLRRIAGKCSAVSSRSKPWATFKERGRDMLSDELKKKFDHLARICAQVGLCINQHGELESLLVDLGIEYTSDKRAWIQRALALVPNLQVDPSKKVWTFLAEIHSRLNVGL